MIRYNICFIQQGDRFLLLNREKPSWMGCWNGVGGKLEPHESPRQSMIREIAEETGLTDAAYLLTYKGLVSWTVDREQFGGMYLYAASVAEPFAYATPRKTEEGILDWKTLEWILHPKNQGVSTNIPLIMTHLAEPFPFHHHCHYADDKLAAAMTVPLETATEKREQMNEYLKKFMTQNGLKANQPIANR
ncbi:NUDIX hydrolase [Brevibacillus fluminis]|uniref:NUDIX hydrolase n=1 Tax=Brevibacillus fluminis TaxID=511487 RepID=UPI003F89F0FE